MGKSNIQRKQIKFISQALTVMSKPSVLINTGGFVLTSWIISFLIYKLSGYYEYVIRMYNSIKMTGEIYTGPWPQVSAYAVIICVLLALLKIIMDAGYAGYTLQISRGKKAGFKDMFCGFDCPVKVLVVGLYKYLCIYIGLSLFILPGIYFAYRYRFAFFSLFDDEEISAVEALKKSAGEIEGNKIKMLIFDASFLGWIIAGFVLGQGFVQLLEIWVRPYMGIAGAVCYNLITGKGGVVTIKIGDDGSEIITQDDETRQDGGGDTGDK